jgi:hypothetical protein
MEAQASTKKDKPKSKTFVRLCKTCHKLMVHVTLPYTGDSLLSCPECHHVEAMPKEPKETKE